MFHVTKCLHATHELEERFAPFLEHLQNYTEEKDQMIFFTCAVLLSHRGLRLNKINVFCFLIKDYDITKKLKIKEKITTQILSFNLVKHKTLQ